MLQRNPERSRGSNYLPERVIATTSAAGYEYGIPIYDNNTVSTTTSIATFTNVDTGNPAARSERRLAICVTALAQAWNSQILQ